MCKEIHRMTEALKKKKKKNNMIYYVSWVETSINGLIYGFKNEKEYQQWKSNDYFMI